MSQTGPLVEKNALFEIGSITKVFTGILLADTILQKKAALNHPISMYLAEETIPANSPLSKITLLEQATHTSRLPRRPSDLLEDGESENLYYHYTREKFILYKDEIVYGSSLKGESNRIFLQKGEQ